MDRLTENIGCYAKEEQRRILFRLFKHETIAGNFFLTGGTALSVFYLHHRYSKDIDLFSIIQPVISHWSLGRAWKCLSLVGWEAGINYSPGELR